MVGSVIKMPEDTPEKRTDRWPTILTILLCLLCIDVQRILIKMITFFLKNF